MEIPISVAVRIKSNNAGADQNIVAPVFLPEENPGIKYVQAGSQIFPVALTWPAEVSQNHLYNTAVHPMMPALLEGVDVSIVTFGQAGSGKTYTMLGPGLHCAHSETEHGLIPRSIREIFNHLINHPERTYIMNINWFKIHGNEIKNLFEDTSGNIQINSISEAFYWLQQGITNLEKNHTSGHLLFTICLEQQWISAEGYIQHRMSTMSFSDLCGTERILTTNEIGEKLYVPTDFGLRNLENIITILSSSNINRQHLQHMVPYDQSTLTALLRDSFGGRAKTTFICCVSPLQENLNETIANLQLCLKVQNVWNTVLLNTFSDNNTPVDNGQDIGNQLDFREIKAIDTNSFGIQFAASQWLKLVSNAEGLFQRLVGSNALNEQDSDQIEEWLFLKQECEECLSSGDGTGISGPLRPIAEEQPDNNSDCSDDQYNNVTFDDSELNNNLTGIETSDVISDTEGLEQSDTDSQKAAELQDKLDSVLKQFRTMTEHLTAEAFDKFLISQPKSTMNSTISFEDDSNVGCCRSLAVETDNKRENVNSSNDDKGYGLGRRKSVQPGHSLSSLELQLLQRAASSGAAALPDCKEDCVSAHKEKYERQTQSTIETLRKKMSKILEDIEVSNKQISDLEQTISLKELLVQELMQNSGSNVTSKPKFSRKKIKLQQDLEKAKNNLLKAKCALAEHSSAEIIAEIEKWKSLCAAYEQKLRDMHDISGIAAASAQQLREVQSSLQDSKKQLEVIQKHNKKLKKEKQAVEKEIKNELKNETSGKHDKKSLRDMTARISHLDQVLKEKSQHLLPAADTAEQKSVRLEIRNLRKIRDHLQKERYSLRGLRGLHFERQLLECEEAIEAIDTAIELKNEKICGRASVLDSGNRSREEGERMLMARLNKLSLTETRTLLYKYFQKVIDLRESGRKWELEVLRLESEQKRTVEEAVMQARMKFERDVIYLQQQHQKRLKVLLRQLDEETSASSHTERERFYTRGNYEAYDQPGSSKTKSKGSSHCKDVGLYKPFDKEIEQTVTKRNKFYAKLPKFPQALQIIPLQNLKQLQSPSGPVTKVTREKNKIIIQQDHRN